MTRTLPTLALVAALTALSGCAGLTPVQVKGTGVQPTQGQQGALAGSVVVGQVIAPANVISAGGGNVISAGGGNVISAGGGNVISAGGGNLQGRHVFGVTEKPLAGVEVYMADAAGNPIPTIPAVKTDANGKYAFPKVPAGYTFVVAARVKTKDGKDATLQALTRTSDLGATADVTAASTVVTVGIVEGQSGSLTDFNPASFKSAVEAAHKGLSDDKLPDWSERQAVKAKLEELSQTVAELKTAVDSMRKELSDVKAELEALKQKMGQAFTNKNGMQPGGQGGQGPFGPDGPKTCGDVLKLFDADKDGFLVLDDFKKMLATAAQHEQDPSHLPAPDLAFRGADMNRDGKVDEKEFCAFLPPDALNHHDGPPPGMQQGMQPGMQQGTMMPPSTPSEHKFWLRWMSSDTSPFPIDVELRKVDPMTKQVFPGPRVKFGGPQDAIPMTVGDNMEYEVWATKAGASAPEPRGRIFIGAGMGDVFLDLGYASQTGTTGTTGGTGTMTGSTGTTTGTTSPTNTMTCSEPKDHTFSLGMPHDGAAFPLTVEVQTPDGSMVVTKLLFAEQASLPTGRMPEGCRHRLRLVDANGKDMGLVDNFFIEPGTTASVKLPI